MPATAGHPAMSAKTLSLLATATAVLAFLVLAAGFVLKWAAHWQVIAGLVTVVAIEWHRREAQKIEASADRPDAQ